MAYLLAHAGWGAGFDFRYCDDLTRRDTCEQRPCFTGPPVHRRRCCTLPVFAATFSRPYRGFSLVSVELATGSATKRLRVRWRFHVWVFLWWRQILAGMIASVLSMPLNILLAIMGLQVAQWVAVFAGILVVGPILVKMLIGHEFGEFRIEVRREQRLDKSVLVTATSK